MADLDEAGEEYVLLTLTTGLKHKAEMIKAGETRRTAECPRCQGDLHLSLQGRKSHLWMFCDGCKTQMLE